MLTRSERLALLVNLLGDDAAEAARSGLKGDSLKKLENALSDFQEFPPSQDEIDLVLDDFTAYFQLALESYEEASEAAAEDDPNSTDEAMDGDQPAILRISEEQFDVELEPEKRFEQPSLTGNTTIDLNRVHPYQVAQALRSERAEIIVVVIRKLADEHAAKTIEFLPDDVRPTVFMKLADSSPIQSLVVDRVMQETLNLAIKVQEREVEEESSEKMARLMRSLPRNVRTPMLEQLEAQDAELAESVKSQLYLFDDLLKLDPKDLQKLLGQCRSDVLVVALQQVDEELLQHVLGNMSKRAKESLQEEMEFKQNAKQDEIDEGRSEVVKTMVELIEAGTITVE